MMILFRIILLLLLFSIFEQSILGAIDGQNLIKPCVKYQHLAQSH